MDKLRNLEAYITLHKSKAEEKGVLSEFLSAETLTQAKAIVFGSKRKTKHRKPPREKLEG